MAGSQVTELGQMTILASEDLLRQARALLPSPGDVSALLGKLNQGRGVPVLVEEIANQPRISLGAGGVVLVAVPAGEGAALTVTEIRPFRLPEQDRFARQALWVRAAGWQVSEPRSARVSKDARQVVLTLIRAWREAQRHEEEAAPTDRTGAAHERYLDYLDALIGLTRRLEQDRLLLDGAGPAYPYLSATPAEQGRWLLQLPTTAPRPRPRTAVRLREAPEWRGTVTGQTRTGVIVDFGPIPPDALTGSGTLEPLPSLAQYTIQREAVATLRAGGATNPHLLDMLVEQNYQARPKTRKAEPSPPATLDPDQAAAWQAAQSVTDALLVLGPPGTGKTHTIAQIAQTLAAHGQRILVTARTHRAVDNALERLGQIPGLRIIRAGQPERVAPGTRPLLLEQQMTGLQDQIATRVQTYLADLERALALVGDATGLHQVDQQNAERDALVQEMAEMTASMALARATIDTRLGVSIRLWEAELAPDVARLVAWDQRIAGLAARRATRDRQSQRRVIGWLWLLPRLALDQRIGRQQTRRDQFSASIQATAAEYFALRNERAAALASAELQRQTERQAALQVAIGTSTTAAHHWLAELDAVFAPVADDRPAFDPLQGGSPPTYLTWVRSLVPVLRQRLEVARAWLAAVRQGAEMLIPVLLENADVVGATCIGVATTRDLPDEDFDVVIADEAGQIGLADLLVPLVRGRRAILVGDHHQLPPFVPDEVRHWLAERPTAEMDASAGAAMNAVTGLLTRSAFELLFPQADAAHRVLLTRQKRMPRVIADFIAQHFYGGQLHTETDTAPPASAPYLPQALTWIDTSDQTRTARAEMAEGANGDPESFGRRGYRNEAEGTLIAELVAHYARAGLDWVVITPYQAQAEWIRAALREQMPIPLAELTERVATVDAFQGGERDYVFFSFTRSNHQGAIGFLSELRRLNVTMSRARRQLLLVGDVATLCAANDPAFQRLARALLDHVLANGERLRSSELSARIAAWKEDQV